MAVMIGIPLKKTYEVDLIKPLKGFIQNTFTSVSVDDYQNALHEFNKLRNTMIAKSLDKHESALDILARYFDQLCAIENKLPIRENQIRVQFKWRDAFDVGSFLAGKKTLAIASGLFEKVCVLYNIAALQSQIASSQNLDSDEGLRVSAKYFQQASGLLGHLKDIVMSHVQQEPTPDLNPDTVSCLAAIMLAQAQEVIYKKATLDRMKESMVSKLAFQCSELYSDSAKLMQLVSIREIWPREWVSMIAMKQAAFHSVAEYYQSMVAQQNRCYGEEIARLEHAIQLMTTAQQRGGTTFSFRSEMTRMQRGLELSRKDNDFIYHDRIPDIRSLPVIGKAAVAKATLFSTPLSSRFTDLFEKLVPLPVYEALQMFENRKNTIVNMEIGRLREATALVNSALSSLNLPAALEDQSGQKVPQSVLDKAQQVQQLGGMAHIDSLIDGLPDLLLRNRETLDESVRCLEDEERSDNQLRELIKEQWTRTRSDVLTKPMRDKSEKYRRILDTAVQADGIVRDKYVSNKRAITLLSQSPDELERALPTGGQFGSVQDDAVVKELQSLCEQVETVKTERMVTESELKQTQFDMSGKFLSALASDSAIDECSLSGEELDRVYAPLRQQVGDSIQRQEKLLSSIQMAYTQFTNARSSDREASSREQLLKELASGFDNYIELRSNLEEGRKFYNDLTPLLLKQQMKITDFCFARKTEKEELMNDIQKQIANRPTQLPPSVPKYQTGSSSGTALSPPSHQPALPPHSSTTPSTVHLPYPTQPPVGQFSSGHENAENSALSGVYSQWPSAPYPTYPGAGGYPMPPMPSAYNAYNPYLQYPQPTAMQLAPASAYLSGQCPTPQQQGSIMGGQHPPPPPVTFPPQPQYGHNQPPAGR